MSLKSWASLTLAVALMAVHKVEAFRFPCVFDRGKSYDDIPHKHRKHRRGRPK